MEGEGTLKRGRLINFLPVKREGLLERWGGGAYLRGVA